ncbi:MAG: phosphate acyltransferase PlsX [Candidatus Marinimicrobia bacterium]|jgi:glycerol-3-phosphate acyltransferase PlsX|nr:phosphate acyltransferase PlsX [Candidatus Neomarinimicrobiota bacterium]MDP6966232.1 phosphate acyltransferase PlsX [Candidatus Neomarinimicrobiota bacterium]|tara:strand:- start:2005 stop:3039 length:1035 start_codon:yes stop_codon:yes gene_type:complete
MITIALDAMGGDHAPRETVHGAALASTANPVRVLLVGDKSAIEEELERHDYPADGIEIVHASETISMEDSPKKAVESKPDASILVAASLVGEGEADALVSAGSTGSVVLSAARTIARISGVKRTAIATVYPTLNEFKRDDHLALMVDVGANVESSAEELMQFAIMGSAYVANVRGVESPKAALLNIGEEETKGSEKMQTAHHLLKEVPSLDFSGNIEGKDILRGVADVIVTEGFVGNIVIKTLEGAAMAASHLGEMAFRARLGWKVGLFFLRKGLKRVREVTDYAEYGGAPLLGFEKMVIIAHGRSSGKAISNAIKLAGKSVRDGVCETMAHQIGEFKLEEGGR